MDKADSGLRLLIAGACIAVIVGVGYYLFGEYRNYQRQKDEAEQEQLQAVLREDCVDQLAKLNKAFGISPTEKNRIANCLYMGSLTDAEVAERERVLDVPLR
ncbi:hypothetical protein Mesau_05925 [Mesorhizobium australicum WSM2073]|uniref:Uncharacterized protein n=3 Tax=Mesorhizobium TaxID=68287 RepID=L0KVY7_MESAW|nr:MULTISPECIES: hypothetical protein [Mesorhizobium]ADV14897.1 hypothetical protein Mesci_5879 [Mesorhizobium ciceri biovar biserrulae WSM1271]AEH90784.1 hypothetical protein Mesop_6452 [Mesorhizobium opportunistum WSM2075]AGB48154.1 hypothetical protein Mesau_05925 [Mesorhizobium australicum WSM2073]OBP84744.1 hypothetical protein BAE40_29785 [Mesorhizobium loti]